MHHSALLYDFWSKNDNQLEWRQASSSSCLSKPNTPHAWTFGCFQRLSKQVKKALDVWVQSNRHDNRILTSAHSIIPTLHIQSPHVYNSTEQFQQCNLEIKKGAIRNLYNRVKKTWMTNEFLQVERSCKISILKSVNYPSKIYFFSLLLCKNCYSFWKKNVYEKICK